MSRKFKFRDDKAVYFVSFATVKWIDVFIRTSYKDLMLDSIKFCQREKGLVVYAWCIMTNHVHLIISSDIQPLFAIMRDLKKFTSVRLIQAIEQNPEESRKDWMLWIFGREGKWNVNNKNYQFWQQHNHPIELSDATMARQRLDYLHNNPVEAGFVCEPEDYWYSSARDYAGKKGLLEIEFLF